MEQEIIKSDIANQGSQLTFPLDPVTQNIIKSQNTAVPVMLYGTVTLASGSYTITDPRISTDSTILATSESSNSTGIGGPQTLAAVCNSGNAVIFVGGGTSSDVVNYLIII